MSTGDQTLQIFIKTVADNTGLTLTTDQAGKLKEKLDAASKGQANFAKETKGAHEQLTALRESGRGGREMLEGLSRASQGGVGAIGGVAEATRGFIGVLRGAVGAGASGPIGAVIGGIGLIVGVMKVLHDSSKAVESSQDEVNLALKRSAEAADKLDQKRLENFNRSIATAVKSSQQLLANLQQEIELQDKLDEAKASAKKAAIDADPNLSADQKESQKQAIDAGVIASHRGRENDLDTAREKQANDETNTLLAAQAVKAEQVTALRARRDAVEANKGDAERQLAMADKSQHANLIEALLGGTTGSGLAGAASYLGGRDQQSRAQARFGTASSDKATTDTASLNDSLKLHEADLKSAQAATAAAGDREDKLHDELTNKRRFQPGIDSATDAATGIQNRQSQIRALQEAESNAPARITESLLHKLPGANDRTQTQEEAVAKRAADLHSESIGKGGQSAGMNMASATAQAIAELLPKLTDVYQKQMRLEVDAAVNKEIARVEAQLKALRR